METFLAFLGVCTIVIATPGPDTAITIRNTLLGGRAGGVMTALGIASGQLVWPSRRASAWLRSWSRPNRFFSRSNMPAPPISSGWAYTPCTQPFGHSPRRRRMPQRRRSGG